MSGLTPIGELLPDDYRKPKRKAMNPDDVPLTEKEELVLEMVHVGIGLRKAESLASRYPFERIRRQLAWLPSRSPRKPASLLITAIEQDYGAPAYGDNE